MPKINIYKLLITLKQVLKITTGRKIVIEIVSVIGSEYEVNEMPHLPHQVLPLQSISALTIIVSLNPSNIHSQASPTMLRQSLIGGASLIAILSIWAALRPSPPPTFTPGRKNTVLFITDSANGLSNVHLATLLTLVSSHPNLDLHYASFAKLKPDVQRISPSITWHELPPPDLVTTFDRAFGNVAGIASPPGLRGISKTTRDVQILLAPWTAEEHWSLYQVITGIIDEVDPAVVVLDSIFRPGVEATQDANRMHLFLSPNSLTDALAHKQPWGAMFWKYPP